MRIVIDNGEYAMANLGDLAMLDVTVERLADRWPGAEIGILTTAPAFLRYHRPDVAPLRVDVNPAVPGSSRALDLLDRALPQPAVRALLEVRVEGDRRARELGRPVKRAVVDRLGRSQRPPEPEIDAAQIAPHPAVDEADLLLAMGGGYLTDVDREQLGRTIANLRRAQERGIPTAMVSQGVGPLDDSRLRRLAGPVLSRVDLIGLREGRTGPGLLASLGVPSELITVTGDDAIELGYRMRRIASGAGVGVNVRVAGYAPMETEQIGALRRAVQSAAGAGATIVPLHISVWRDEDRRWTRLLTEGHTSVAPEEIGIPTAADLVQRIGYCRVVVTGAYHAAVLALSQGIPAVCLSTSDYYADKFFGLETMFGAGCTVVETNEHDLEQRVAEATKDLFANATELRPGLLRAAERQIQACRELYDRMRDVVEQSRSPTAA